MVSESSSSSSSSSNLLHHFIASNTLSNNQTHFDSYSNGPINHPISVISSDKSNGPFMEEAQRLSLSLGGSDPRNRQRPPPPSSYFTAEDYSFTESLFLSSPASSKYLKPAQTLLEEIASVGGKEIDTRKYVQKLSRENRKGSYRLSAELEQDLSISQEKHQIQTHAGLLHLFSLLEEVETRYEEYCQKMEAIVSSFEVIAGLGSGKSYTALALQAMSKHFLKLRNAIVYQIKSTIKLLRNDDDGDNNNPSNKISSSLSELTLLELGIVRNSRQAWRPIRGLPESSVTVLRSWLFEHFLHPYPTDSEKLMLASQTGLSKNQVSNWFINARVRLWKPMIEEMYREEFREEDSNE